ncbi:MAG: hypothetical protein QOH04_725 [Sphingomonadales bacterium]|nr:hypothetical protein [Sphingomonadales bacterium]MEA3034966.1 hypothetical protein [Sphingomonadales bacterium]
MRSKRRRRRERLTAGRIAAYGAACAGVLLAAWLVVRTSIVDAAAANPFLAERIAPSNPRPKLAVATVLLLLRGGRLPPDVQREALEALGKAPLAEEPFLIAGIQALARGDVRKGEQLLTEVRRRNPRQRLARLLLLDRYLREHRTAEATVEITVLTRLIGAAQGVLTGQLAQMASDPATAPQMLPILAAHPDLQTAVLEALAANGADADLIMRVAALSRGGYVGSDQQWQRVLLARLVERGEIGRALVVWAKLAGLPPPRDGEKGLYDGTFRGAPGAEPFNWGLATEAIGVAERTGRSSLQVDYYGRDAGSLARQLLILRPGRYRFQFRVSGHASGEGSRLVWTLACQPGGAALLRLPLAGIDSTAKEFKATFTVPAGCAGQWLKLEGVPGDVETAQSVTLGGLSIGPERGT